MAHGSWPVLGILAFRTRTGSCTRVTAFVHGYVHRYAVYVYGSKAFGIETAIEPPTFRVSITPIRDEPEFA